MAAKKATKKAAKKAMGAAELKAFQQRGFNKPEGFKGAEK